MVSFEEWLKDYIQRRDKVAEIKPTHEHDPATGRGKFSGEISADEMDGLGERTQRNLPVRNIQTPNPKNGKNPGGRHRIS